MQIAIIGAGRVGRTLGARFAEAGHAVTYGVRAPADPKHAGLQVASVASAVARADLVLLSTGWADARAAVDSAGDLSGKILVDATNPIGPGMVSLFGPTDSGAETVQRWAPSARVVKAFNTIGAEVMASPRFPGGNAFLPICGDDVEACATVVALADAIGFAPIRLGPLARARITEPVALLWITATQPLGSREFAFGVLRR